MMNAIRSLVCAVSVFVMGVSASLRVSEGDLEREVLAEPEAEKLDR